MEAADSMRVEEPHEFQAEGEVGGDQIAVVVPRLSFHRRCGKGVTITKVPELVKKASCTSHAIALTNRPLEYDEPFMVEITRINTGVPGNLSFGVTEHSPEKISFPVVMEALRSGTWVVEITSGGQVFIKVNGQTVETFHNYNHLKCGNCLSLSVSGSGMLHINTMWAKKVAATNLPKRVYGFVDLCGGCDEVRIIRDARNDIHQTALQPQDRDKSLQLKWQHHIGLEKRLNEMAIENFSETATAASQPVVPKPVVPIKNRSKDPKSLDSVEVANENSEEGQRVPLYKELEAQDDGPRSHPADVIRSHAQDLPTEESGEQVKRLQKLLQQKILALEVAKNREKQATAELKAKNEELQSQVHTLEKQLERAPNQPTPTTLQSQEGEFWEVPRMDVTLNMQEHLRDGDWGYEVKGRYHGQEVAVKCLQGLIRDSESVNVIRREVRIMAQIRHPNIVLLIAAVIEAKETHSSSQSLLI